MNSRTLLLPGLFGLLSAAQATTLTLNVNADDTFVAYLSNSATLPGTAFVTDPDLLWFSQESGSITLGSGTQYLHIKAKDLYGGPSALIASATLSDGAFKFANGGQAISTNTTDWTASLAGFGGASATVLDLGVNGVSPWGSQNTIDAGAHWIWTPGGQGDERYFTTRIDAVPEPASLAALGVGAIALLRRRKRA